MSDQVQVGARDAFVFESRIDQIECFAMDAADELLFPTLAGYADLNGGQRNIVLEAIQFGARAACTLLGVANDYEAEYQTMLHNLRAQLSSD